MTALLVLLTLWLAWDLGRHWGDGGLGRLRDDDLDGLRRAERARDAIGRATTHDRETTCRPTD